eukprot:6080901-Prymnesium_polylepis.1
MARLTASLGPGRRRPTHSSPPRRRRWCPRRRSRLKRQRCPSALNSMRSMCLPRWPRSSPRVAG